MKSIFDYRTCVVAAWCSGLPTEKSGIDAGLAGPCKYSRALLFLERLLSLSMCRRISWKSLVIRLLLLLKSSFFYRNLYSREVHILIW